MRKTFTYLSLFIAFMLVGTMNVWAQFEGRVEQYPTSDYATDEIRFSLTSVAEVLGTDTATLAKDLGAWADAYNNDVQGDELANLIFLNQTDETKSDNYTQGSAGGFWMTSEGNVGEWNVNSTWYNQISWDTAEDAFSFWVGQFPDTLIAGNSTNGTVTLSYNGKEASFKLGIDVVAIPEIELMADTIHSSAISVIATKSIDVIQYPRSNYNGTSYNLDFSDVIEGLGANEAALAANLNNMLYAYYYIATNDVKSDSLTNHYSSNTGFWFYPLTDESTGNYSGEVASAYSGDSRFYVESFNYDTDTKEFTFSLGQMPSINKADEKFTGSIYLVYNGKAIEIKINFIVEAEPTVNPDELTMVGKKTYTVEQFPTTDYSTTAIQVNVDSIASLIGCSATDIQLKAYSSEGVMSTNSTANNGGFWLNHDGYICAYADAEHAFFIEPASSSSLATLNVGQYPSVLKAGDVRKASLVYIFGGNYFEVEVVLNVVEKEEIKEDEIQIVATEGIIKQIIPSSDYPAGDNTVLDIDYIVSLIGEAPSTGYTFYGMSAPIYATDGSDSIPSKMSDAYSCDPKPGFWMDKNGYVSNWGNDNGYGISYLPTHEFQWFQYPNARTVGDEISSTFFLFNSNTNKMIQYNVFVQYVETIVETEIVGTEDVIAAIDNPEDLTYTKVDLTAAATALGIDNPDLFGSAEVKILKTATSYTSDFYDETMGWFLDKNGWCYDVNNNPDAAMTAPVNLGYDWDFASYDFNFFTTAMGDAPADGVIYRTKVALEYDAKLYIFNVKIMNRETANGIENIDAANKVNAGNVYDLSGRLVRKNATSVKGLANGVYLLNGKKYIVK